MAIFSEIQETHNKLTVGFTPLCLEEVCPCLLLWWGLWRAPPWRLRPDIPFYNTANSLISPLQNSETQHRYEKQIERNLLATESSLELSYLKTPIYTESLSRWIPWLTPLPDLALFDLLGLLLDDLFFLALLRRIPCRTMTSVKLINRQREQCCCWQRWRAMFKWQLVWYLFHTCQ